MLFFGKENVFMYLVAFQIMCRKIFSDVWLCSWKYHRKHIFYLLLTFSRLSNEYIISFIPQNTNKTQKKIIKSGQNEGEIPIGEIAIGVVGASCDRDRRVHAVARCVNRYHAMCRLRSWSRDASESRDCAMPMMSMDDAMPVKVAISSFSLSLSLSLFSIFQGRKSFEVKMEMEMIFRYFGSQIRSTGNAFQFDRIWSNNQTPPFSGKSFSESVWS